jgi:hypothetical protein
MQYQNNFKNCHMPMQKNTILKLKTFKIYEIVLLMQVCNRLETK